MTNPDHNQGGVTSVIGRCIGRNRRTVIGVAGLAAALSVGAFVVTDELTGENKQPTTASEPRRIAAEPTPAIATNTEPAAQPTPSGSAVPVVPARVGASSSPRTLDQRLTDARSANARLGTGARPPLPPKNGGYVADASKIRVETMGNIKRDHKTMRVVSAPLDLSGQRELAWVADAGEEYHGARCSQKIKMSNNTVAEVRPTLLICFRTSATRSAYTVLVDVDQKPSKQESVAALDRAWAKLG